VSETNVAIQIAGKKGIYIFLDCFANARNDGVIKKPLSLAALASSPSRERKLSHRE